MELSGGHAMINLSLFLVKDEKRRNAVSGIEAKVGSGLVRSGSGGMGTLCDEAVH